MKFSVVTGGNSIEAVVWRRGVMNDQDVDDVAFLTGTIVSSKITHSISHSQSSPLLINNPCDSGAVARSDSPDGAIKKSLYEKNGVAACSHNRALCIATIVFALLFTVAVIIAFTGPQSGIVSFGYLTFDLTSFYFIFRLHMCWWKTGEFCGRTMERD